MASKSSRNRRKKSRRNKPKVGRIDQHVEVVVNSTFDTGGAGAVGRPWFGAVRPAIRPVSAKASRLDGRFLNVSSRAASAARFARHLGHGGSRN